MQHGRLSLFEDIKQKVENSLGDREVILGINAEDVTRELIETCKYNCWGPAPAAEEVAQKIEGYWCQEYRQRLLQCVYHRKLQYLELDAQAAATQDCTNARANESILEIFKARQVTSVVLAQAKEFASRFVKPYPVLAQAKESALRFVTPYPVLSIQQQWQQQQWWQQQQQQASSATVHNHIYLASNPVACAQSSSTAFLHGVQGGVSPALAVNTVQAPPAPAPRCADSGRLQAAGMRFALAGLDTDAVAITGAGAGADIALAPVLTVLAKEVTKLTVQLWYSMRWKFTGYSNLSKAQMMDCLWTASRSNLSTFLATLSKEDLKEALP